MLRRRLPAGPDQRRRDGKDQLGPVFDGRFHGGLRLFPGVDAVENLQGDALKVLDGNLLSHHRLQVLPAQIVGPGPVALLRQLVADKSHAEPPQLLGPEDAAQEVFLLGLRRLRADGDGPGEGLDVRPDGLDALRKLRLG